MCKMHQNSSNKQVKEIVNMFKSHDNLIYIFMLHKTVCMHRIQPWRSI